VTYNRKPDKTFIFTNLILHKIAENVVRRSGMYRHEKPLCHGKRVRFKQVNIRADKFIRDMDDFVHIVLNSFFKAVLHKRHTHRGTGPHDKQRYQHNHTKDFYTHKNKPPFFVKIELHGSVGGDAHIAPRIAQMYVLRKTVKPNGAM
jgi:hypothetical protein